MPSFQKNIIALVIVFCFGLSSIIACGCSSKPVPDIINLNDSELIFTATLLEYHIGMAAGVMRFKAKHVYKGILDDTITIYFQPKNSHLLVDKDAKFVEQQDWIVFARIKTIGARNYYRLMEADGSGFCALSRPVLHEEAKDDYLEFLLKMSAQADGHQKFYTEENNIFAEGFYKNNTPVQEWKYYRERAQLEISGEYLLGKRNGEWLKYSSNSRGEIIVIQKRFYDQGELKEIHDLNYSGEITMKKIFSDTAEIRHYFDDDGDLKSITHRNKENDSLKTYIYYKNGLLQEEKYFERNKLIYQYRFDENGQSKD